MRRRRRRRRRGEEEEEEDGEDWGEEEDGGLALACVPSARPRQELHAQLHTTTQTTTTHTQGYPIFVERLGLLDARRLEKAGLDERRVLAYHLREMEFMAQVSGRLGPIFWSMGSIAIDRLCSLLCGRGHLFLFTIEVMLD